MQNETQQARNFEAEILAALTSATKPLCSAEIEEACGIDFVGAAYYEVGFALGRLVESSKVQGVRVRGLRSYRIPVPGTVGRCFYEEVG